MKTEYNHTLSEMQSKFAVNFANYTCANKSRKSARAPSVEFPVTDLPVTVVSPDPSAALSVCLRPDVSCECTASTASDTYTHRSTSSSLSLIERHTMLSTVSDRAFPVAAAPCLEQTTMSRHACIIHATFLQLSEESPFPLLSWLFCSACEATCVIIGHNNRFCYLLTYTPRHNMAFNFKTTPAEVVSEAHFRY